MKTICSLCGKPIALSQDGKLPPWCPSCGVELENGSLPIASPDVTLAPSPEDEGDWKERFGMHNLVVGILLFVWGAFISAAPPQSGGDKVLRSYERLNDLI